MKETASEQCDNWDLTCGEGDSGLRLILRHSTYIFRTNTDVMNLTCEDAEHCLTALV